LLPKGRHPAAFLRLELGPGEVDVNVHPAKSAVRLRGGRSAYPLVVGTIRSALAQEREMGGGAPPEEGSDGLTLIGQFAGRCQLQKRERMQPGGTAGMSRHPELQILAN
jgi:DNA mismatch repair protein MutL